MKPSIFGPRVAPTTLAFTTAFEQVAAGGQDGVAVDEQHGRELELGAVVGADQLDLELLALLDPVLLAAGLDHCVHGAGNPSNRARKSAEP